MFLACITWVIYNDPDFCQPSDITSLINIADAPHERDYSANQYSFNSQYGDVLKDITFPINIKNAPHRRGYYFAQQFHFLDQSETRVGISYTGLQPQSDATNGTSIIHAAFSSFIKDTTINDHDHCTPGADNGPGVSCAVIFAGTYKNTYNLEVRNIEGTTWNGTVIDTVTGRRVHIGSYTLPVGTGGIERYERGFVEYFLGTPPCEDLPHTSVVFGLPSTKSGGLGCFDEDAQELDICKGKSNFHSKRTAQEIEISVGFK